MLNQPIDSATPESARRVMWRALWTSRLVIMGVGVFAVLSFGRAAGTNGFDPSRLTAPFGYFGNLLAAPVARWDSVWYLAIAHGGYDHEPARTAFFPLYPMVMRGLGTVIGSDLVAGVVISLVSFALGLLLLHKLVALELGDRHARATVMLLAFCPVAYFFSAVYSESLYLALSVGAIYEARVGRWPSAGLLGGIAAASRNSGIVLIVPLVLIYLYGPREDRPPPELTAHTTAHTTAHVSTTRGFRARGLPKLSPRHPIRPSIAWIALVPAGLGAYVGWLALKYGDGLAPFHAQQVWFRHFAGPFGGVWDGSVAAWDALRQIIHGPPPPLYFTAAGGDAIKVAGQNLFLFGFLIVGIVAAIGALRRLPLAYGAYALVALAMPLSYPVTPLPLASLPRYEVVLFPLFMSAALWLEKRRLTFYALASCAVLLGLFTAEFATWRFVA